MLSVQLVQENLLFIKLLYREEKPTSGKVEVVGQDVSKIKK